MHRFIAIAISGKPLSAIAEQREGARRYRTLLEKRLANIGAEHVGWFAAINTALAWKESAALRTLKKITDETVALPAAGTHLQAVNKKTDTSN
jgi:hypothetical protein